jgi:C-terminal processing protease CtpA/Prc
VRLANDVVVNLSSWRDLLPDGTCFEGMGIAPDIEVPAKPGDFAGRDPVLEAAIAYLSAKPEARPVAR